MLKLYIYGLPQACDKAGITAILPKPLTSGNKVKGRFVKQDFRYAKEEDAYICPAGERLVLPLHERGKGTDLAPLLNHCLPGMGYKRTSSGHR